MIAEGSLPYKILNGVMPMAVWNEELYQNSIQGRREIQSLGLSKIKQRRYILRHLFKASI